MSLHTDPQIFQDNHLGSLAFEKTRQKWAVCPEVYEQAFFEVSGHMDA